MFHEIMVAYDESPESGRALEEAILLAGTLKAHLSIVTVLEPPPSYFSWAMSALPLIEWSEKKRTKYMSLQASAIRQAGDAGLAVDAELVNGDEVDSIIDCAKKYHADLLVMGMPHHLLLTGSTSKEIAQRSPCALMGVR